MRFPHDMGGAHTADCRQTKDWYPLIPFSEQQPRRCSCGEHHVQTCQTPLGGPDACRTSQPGVSTLVQNTSRPTTASPCRTGDRMTMSNGNGDGEAMFSVRGSLMWHSQLGNANARKTRKKQLVRSPNRRPCRFDYPNRHPSTSSSPST